MDKTNMMAYIGGIVRIVTSVLGGYLAQKGLATEAETESITGAAVLVEVACVAAAIASHRDSQRQAPAGATAAAPAGPSAWKLSGRVAR